MAKKKAGGSAAPPPAPKKAPPPPAPKKASKPPKPKKYYKPPSSSPKVYWFGGKSFPSIAARNAYIALLEQADARRDAALAQRRKDEAARAARRRAFEALKRRQKSLYDDLHRGAEQDRTDLASSYRKRDEKIDRAATDSLADRYRKAGEIVTSGETARKAAIGNAVKTGDFETALAEIRKAQKDTGGRYINRKYYEDLYAAYQKHAQDVSDRFASLAEKANALYKKGDINGLIEILDGSDFKDARSAFVKIYGDGRKPGSLQSTAALFDEVARANDDYLQRSVFNLSSSSDQAELERQRKLIEAALTRRGKRLVTDASGRDKFVDYTYKISLNEYLQELEDKQRKIMETGLQQAKNRQRLLTAEGLREATTESGRRVIVDPRQQALIGTVKRYVGPDTERLFAQLQEGNQVDRQRALDAIVNKAMDEKDRELRAQYGQVNAGMAGPGSQVARNAREAFRRDLYDLLTGGKPPEGVEALLGGAMRLPALGETLKGLGILGSGITGALRYLQTDTTSEAQDFRQRMLAQRRPEAWIEKEIKRLGLSDEPRGQGGRIVTPNIELDALLGSGKSLFSMQGRDSQKEIDEELRAKADFARVIQESKGDIPKQLEGILNYGAEPFQGNVGNLTAAILLDPLIALNVTKILGSGRLAIGRAGSIRSALLSPRVTLQDWSKLMAPKSLGGYGGSAYTLRTTLRDLSKLVRRDLKDVGDLDEDVVQAALRHLIAHPSTIDEAAGFLERTFKTTPINAQQLLNSIQRYTSDKAGTLGIRAINAVDLERQLSRAESIARTTVAKSTRETRRIQAQARAGAEVKAINAVRRASAAASNAPTPAPIRRQAESAATKAARDTYQALLDEAGVQSLRARSAARRLKGTTDTAERQKALAELEDALQKHDDVVEQVVTNPSNPNLTQTVLERAQAEYDTIATPTAARSIAHLSDVELAKDLAYIDSRLKQVRIDIKTATGPDKQRLARTMRYLGAARRVMGEAKVRNKAQGQMAKEVVRRGAKRAEGYIRRPKVASKAHSVDAIVEEQGRDYFRRLSGATPLPARAPLTQAEERLLTHARTVFDQPVDLRAARYDPVRDALDGMTIWDAFFTLRSLIDAGNGLYNDAYRGLAAVISRGLPSGVKIDDFVNLVKSEHQVADNFMSLAEAERLDRAIVAEFRKTGIAKRSGALRFTKQRAGGGDPGPVDRNLAQAAAKARVLHGTGWSIVAYDEAHRVLSKGFVRRNTSVGLLRKTERAVAAGRDFDEAYDDFFGQRLAQEARDDIEAFAMQRRFQGWTADEVLAVFDEEQIARDLQRGSEELSSFAVESLKRATADTLQIAHTQVGDPQVMRRVLGFMAKNAPPLTNRRETYKWLVDNGYWQPRTGQRIREGGTVWSIDEERRFFETSFGWSPPWTDAAALEQVLDDPVKFNDFMTEHGYLDNELELSAAALNLDAQGRAQAISFGTHEGQGIRRGRTREELREWFGQRFGDLTRDAKTGEFTRAPWLMDAGAPEYKHWAERMIREGKLINTTLVKPEQMDSFVKAYAKAVDRRIARLQKKGQYGPGTDWLPQEQMRFAIDVADELMLTKEWRSFFERAPIGSRLLRGVGEIQRLLIVGTLAFPIMNLVDRFTIKQALLMVANNGYRFWSKIDDDAARTISELRSINIHERGLWELRTSSGWQRVRDSNLDRKTRTLGLLDGIKDLGFEISSWGEDSLKLNFARRMYMQVRDDLVAEGMELEGARVIALGQVRKRVLHFFPSLEEASDLERAFNQIVPFFSYNFRNTLLGLEIVAGHPWLWSVQNQIGRLIEEENRESWAAEHPDGEPMPDRLARRLQIRVDGETFAIDFSSISDYFRGPEKILSAQRQPGTLGEWITAFFRAPHPWQVAALSMLNGGETPWGTKATPGEVISLLGFLQGIANGDLNGMSPFGFWAKHLFFSTIAKVDPAESRAMLYFDLLRAGKRDEAIAVLDMYPDAELWIDAHRNPDRFDPRLDGWMPSWFRGRSREDTRKYDAARDGLDAIRQSFDARLNDLYGEPWSEEYRALKKERRAAILAYMLAHPELIDARTVSMSWSEWLDEVGDWAVDDLVDQFFREDEARRPKKGDDELAYQRALAEYLDWRKEWLAANPQVAEILNRGRNALEGAWKDQQAQWDDIVRRQVDVRITILEEEAKGAAKDYDVLDILYDLSNANYTLLDAEAMEGLYEAFDRTMTDKRTGILEGLGSLFGSLPTIKVLPGRSDFFYGNLTPAEKKIEDQKQAEREANGKYAEAIGAIVKAATSGKDFYARLAKDPALMAEYFRRNPDAKARYEAGRAYFGAMQRWVKLLDAGMYDEAQAYFDGLPSWIRERYFAKHPDKRSRAAAGGQYAASMGRWVKLLQAGKFDEAESYFKSLPGWIKDRYFARNPDSKMRDGMGGKGFVKGQGFQFNGGRGFGGTDLITPAIAYFSADDAHKLGILRQNPEFARWLRERGGDEEKRRGIILAAYRSIAKDDAWLKRVFRERYPEIFSQEGKGERRLQSVARKLAENPALVDLYEKWVAYEYHVYREQFKLGAVPPKQLEKEYLRRWKERRRKRRRTARFSKPRHDIRP